MAPRTKEARAYWEAALMGWRRSLRIGLRVKLGAFEVVRAEKGLRLLPHRAGVHPGCFSRPDLPAGLQGWKMDLVLLERHNNRTCTPVAAKAWPAAVRYPREVANVALASPETTRVLFTHAASPIPDAICHLGAFLPEECCPAPLVQASVP